MKLKQLALAAILAPVAVVTYADNFTVTGDLGETIVDKNTGGTGAKLFKRNHLSGGGSVGYSLDNGLGLEADIQHVHHFDTKDAITGAKLARDNTTDFAVDAYYRFITIGAFQPYVLGGLGWNYFHSHQVAKGLTAPNSHVNATLGNLGLGAFYKLNDNYSLRAEVRNAHSFSQHHHHYDDVFLLAGLTYAFGAAPAAAAPAPAAAPVEAAPVAPAPVVAPPPPAPVAPAAPVDSDNDGVPDTADQCPNTPAGVQVDAKGCPVDSDGDGVADYLDKCPNTPAGVAVDSTGCPVDSDADGVPDYLDKCPNTPAGAKVDEKGCPILITEAIKQQIDVLFDSGKSVVKPEFKPELQKVADLVKQYPTAYIEIQGYTDNKGNAKKNVKLSQARADAVRDTLVKDFGIDAKHVTSKGFGGASPVADNKSEAGRAKNRRVIAVLTAEAKKIELAPAKAKKGHHKH